jgi:hypothetical protein
LFYGIFIFIFLFLFLLFVLLRFFDVRDFLERFFPPEKSSNDEVGCGDNDAVGGGGDNLSGVVYLSGSSDCEKPHPLVNRAVTPVGIFDITLNGFELVDVQLNGFKLEVVCLLLEVPGLDDWVSPFGTILSILGSSLGEDENQENIPPHFFTVRLLDFLFDACTFLLFRDMYLC